MEFTALGIGCEDSAVNIWFDDESKLKATKQIKLHSGWWLRMQKFSYGGFNLLKNLLAFDLAQIRIQLPLKAVKNMFFAFWDVCRPPSRLRKRFHEPYGSLPRMIMHKN